MKYFKQDTFAKKNKFFLEKSNRNRGAGDKKFANSFRTTDKFYCDIIKEMENY